MPLPLLLLLHCFLRLLHGLRRERARQQRTDNNSSHTTAAAGIMLLMAQSIDARAVAVVCGCVAMDVETADAAPEAAPAAAVSHNKGALPSIAAFVNTCVFVGQSFQLSDAPADGSKLASFRKQPQIGHGITLLPVLQQPTATTDISAAYLNAVVITQTGTLTMTTTSTGSGSNSNSTISYSVVAIQHHYQPSADDLVIGVITSKHADNYKVDIGYYEPAILDALAFEGASKRNRPNLNVGQLIYCRVSSAATYSDIQLTCISPYIKQDWVTQQSMFGPLTGGLLISSISSTLAATLTATTSAAATATTADNHILSLLGARIAFEIAVGVNNRVWINSSSSADTVVITNLITKTEHMSGEQRKMHVNKFFKATQ